MEIFAKIVIGYKSLTIFVTKSILDVLRGSEYVSANDWTQSRDIDKTLEVSFADFWISDQISNTALKVSLLGVILVLIFPRSDWIRIDTEYLSDYWHLLCSAIYKTFIHFEPRIVLIGTSMKSRPETKLNKMGSRKCGNNIMTAKCNSMLDL